MQKTKDYSIFKLRNDNRADGINKNHVEYLVKCIQVKNMLELNPIICNEDMEVINGQHRLKAAEKLGVDIYYCIRSDIKDEDIIALNAARSWKIKDYFNFYVKNHYPEYLKLDSFIKENDLKLQNAYRLIIGQGNEKYELFYSGKFVFPMDKDYGNSIKDAKETVELLRKLNGHAYWHSSTKFINCLIRLCNHPDFDKNIWMRNTELLSNKFKPCVTNRDYFQLFLSIYNWKNQSHKIEEI